MNFWQLLKTYPRYLLFGFIHFYFSFVGQTFFVSLLVAGICAERGWETEVFAGIFSGVTLLSAFLLPLVGKQIDRFRVRYLSTVVALVMIAGCLLLSFTWHWVWLLLGVLAIRLGGQGVLTLTGSTVTGRFFAVGRGKSLSLVVIGVAVAEMTIPPVVVLLLHAYGYRAVWLAAAALLALVFIPLLWLLIGRHDLFQKADTVAKAAQEKGEASWTRGQVLRDKRFQLILPTLLFMPFVFTGFVFNQGDIAQYRGYSLELMAFGLSLYGFARALALFTAGYVVDRLGAARVMGFILLPAIVGVGLFVFFKAAWTIPALFILSAFSAGCITVAAPTLWADRYGPRFLGSIKSAEGLFTVLSSAAAPIVFSKGLQIGAELWMSGMLLYGLLCLSLTAWERRWPEKKPLAGQRPDRGKASTKT